VSKKLQTFVLCPLLLILAGSACRQKAASDFPVLKGPYLGQNPPGEEPEIFAPGLLQTEESGAFCSVFSPDGNEFYFVSYQRQLDNSGFIAFMQRRGDIWSEPEAASFSGTYLENDMSMSSDGKRMFFRSWRPFPGEHQTQEESFLWFVERTQEGWSEPQQVLCDGKPVNGGYPAITDSGSLYFRLWRDGNVGQSDIFRARWVDGAFAEPENIGRTINTPYIEGDLFVARDESFLIVSCWEHPDNIGGDVGDLYISFRNEDGTWPKLQNMGPLFNTHCGENCPMISPDGKYFFFNRYCEDTDTGNIYWVDARVLDRFSAAKALPGPSAARPGR
jgi:hypothetical protein